MMLFRYDVPADGARAPDDVLRPGHGRSADRRRQRHARRSHHEPTGADVSTALMTGSSAPAVHSPAPCVRIVRVLHPRIALLENGLDQIRRDRGLTVIGDCIRRRSRASTTSAATPLATAAAMLVPLSDKSDWPLRPETCPPGSCPYK